MVDLLGYGEKDSTLQSIVTLAVIGLLSLSLFVWLDVGSLLEATSPSFQSSAFPLVLVLIWRLSCFLVCLRAVVSMWQMNTGTMHVIDHESRQERLVRPLKGCHIQKQRKFSSNKDGLLILRLELEN